MAQMNEREFLTNIINGIINDDVKAHATEGIAKLDARNDKRKNTQTKTQKENEGTMATILDTLVTNGAMVASDIATAVGISTQKASALCKLLVNEGKVEVADIKVKNKGTVKQYTAVVAESVEDTEDTDTTDEVAE